jgi:hypothetical protein
MNRQCAVHFEPDSFGFSGIGHPILADTDPTRAGKACYAEIRTPL